MDKLKDMNPYLYRTSKKLVPWTPRTQEQYVAFIKRVYAMHKWLGLGEKFK